MNTLRSLLFVLGVCVLVALGWRLTVPPRLATLDAVPLIRADARRDVAAARPVEAPRPAPSSQTAPSGTAPSASVPAGSIEAVPAAVALAPPSLVPTPAQVPASTEVLPPREVPGDAPAQPSAVPPAPASQTLARAEPGPATLPAAGGMSAPDPRQRVTRRLADVPQYAAFFSQLDGVFPHVQDHLVDQWVASLAKDGVLASPDSMIWQAVRDIQQTRGVLARQASDEALTAYFDARLAVLDAMAPSDPRLCADFLYGGTDSAMESFSSSHHELVATYASRQLAALASGRDRHGDPATPTAADLDSVAQGLAAKGLSPDEVAMLLDGKTLDPPLSDARLCELGRLYLSVLRALPPEARQRVYGLTAELLARS